MENELEPLQSKNIASYNRSEEIVSECFKLKINDSYTDYEIKQLLVEKYGYSIQTAQKYIEKMWKKCKENVTTNYEDLLAQRMCWLESQIKEVKEPFIRLQYAKELHKISGLHIAKVEVSGQMNNVTTIRIVEHQLPAAQEVIPLTPTDND